MRKFLAVALILAALCVPSYAANPDKDIIILYTNDVHCGIDDHVGYSGFALYAKQMREKSPYVTLVDAGDSVQGATIGAISHGRYIIEIMNYLHYDVAVPGNHEFDYGWDQFENFAKTIECGYISCNLRDAITGQLLFPAYKIFNYGNVKVAYVGICTPETIVASTPTVFMDSSGNYIYDFDNDTTGEKLYASVQKAVNQARDAGADFVIAVGHLGEDVRHPIWSSISVVEHTRGIDAFIDGHSHEVTPAMKVKNLDGREINITQTGTKLAYIGKVVIHTDGNITTELIDKVDGKNDPETDKFIAGIEKRYQDTLSTQIGYVSFDLIAMDENSEWLVRNAETSLCNLAADAFLASVRESKTGSADIAVINGGSLRTNLKAGKITYGDALSILPFGNTVQIREVTGQNILDGLEMGVRLTPVNSGGFLHVAGMTYTINESIATPVELDEHGSMIAIKGPRRVSDVKIHGEPIDPEKIYRIVGTNYVLQEGGDGNTAFQKAKQLEPDYMVDVDALAHYIKSLGIIPERYNHVENRIKFAR